MRTGGTAELGPVRFAATQAQATQNLAHVNAARPQTAALARTQLAPQQQQQQQQQTQAQTQQFQRSFANARPLSAAASYTRGTSQQAQQQAPPQQQTASWELEANRSCRQLPSMPQSQQQYPEERFEQSAGHYAEEAPRGVYAAPAGQQNQRSFQQSFAPGRSLQEQRAAQHAEFSRSIAARFALPEPNANPTVNASPYYVPPYEQPPSSSFAPAARALGNRTYAFEVEDEANYPYAPAFRGSGLISNKPAQDPGQSIPFGRLQAEDAREVRHRMSMDSWSTFNVANRDGNVGFNLDGVKKKQGIDRENYCKWSISRRLPLGDQLRYHVPGVRKLRCGTAGA